MKNSLKVNDKQMDRLRFYIIIFSLKHIVYLHLYEELRAFPDYLYTWQQTFHHTCAWIPDNL